MWQEICERREMALGGRPRLEAICCSTGETASAPPPSSTADWSKAESTVSWTISSAQAHFHDKCLSELQEFGCSGQEGAG